MYWLEIIGDRTALFIEEAGRVVLLFSQTMRWIFRLPVRLQGIFKQMEEIGVKSVPVVIITALSTGMVLAFQSFHGFKRFDAETLVGTVVALSMTRELGPVLTSLMVAGRAGSAMAAELGTMRVTEQIDALITMAVNPIKYLIVPRVIAGMVMLPVLTIFSDMIGIAGGYFIAVNVLGVNPTIYLRRTTDYLELEDIFGGLLKAFVFGIIITTISCYKGFNAQGGAEGVGRATTGAVAISSVLVIVFDYFLTAMLF